jgi:predicted nuclease with RNAse H fold/5-methylcytosine-specific restriction endonuclease McrA
MSTVVTPPPLIIEIDVGAPTKGFHGVALRGTGLVDKFQSKDAIQIAEWCVTQKAVVVSIDAPCRWRAEGGDARLAERELAAAGISSFSTPTESKARGNAFYTWMLAGHDLYAALARSYPVYTDQRRRAQVAIETFPHAVACALAGAVVSAKTKFKVRGDLLRRHGIDASAFKSIDEIDAALCAVAASAFIGGSFKSYGDSDGGFIVVPATGVADREDALAVEKAIGPVESHDSVMRWPIPKWIPRLQSTDCESGSARTARAMLREGGCCIYCGLDLVTNTELLLSAELDHLVPQVIFREAAITGCIKTGDYLANLVFCCGPCNDAKDNWPVCAEETERTRLLTSASREDYIVAARQFTLRRRRSAEKRVAKLMAKVWAQRASKLEVAEAGISSRSAIEVKTSLVQTVLARATR